MFYFYAIGSMVGYALQSVLLARYARRMDGLSLAFYRGTTFFVTMAPLLLGASFEEIAAVFRGWPLLLLTALVGGTHLMLIFASYRYVPVAVSNALSRSIGTIFLTMMSLFLFQEELSTTAILLIAVMLSACLLLAFVKNALPHLDERFLRGAGLASSTGVTLFLVSYALTQLTRQADPLITAYFWEGAVTVGVGIQLAIRSLATGKKVERISMRTYLLIGACAFPTVFGSGLYSLALNSGSIAITNAISTASILVVMLCGWWLYHEKMNAKQIGAMVVILISMIGLRFA